jgi:hypothetical protein
LFLTHFYVIRDHVMFIYTSSKATLPSNIVWLKGLYIEKVQHKDNFGFRLYHESPAFKERTLYHRDEEEIDNWIHKLTWQCNYFSFQKVYLQEKSLGSGHFSQVFMCRNKRTRDVFALKLIEKINIMERE